MNATGRLPIVCGCPRRGAIKRVKKGGVFGWLLRWVVVVAFGCFCAVFFLVVTATPQDEEQHEPKRPDRHQYAENIER